MLGPSSPSKPLATLDGKQQLRKTRQVLSASISADALLHASQSEATPLSAAEWLPVNSQNANNNLNNKKKVLSTPVALNPLSPTRSGAKGALVMVGGLDQAPYERYAQRLEPAENVDLFSYASALCHRVTGRYLPRDLLQSDAGAQQREMERVQRDPELLRAIDAVRVLSTQFKDVARDTMGHRKELGHTLFRIEESYLKLFEKLLELSLRLYWDYEQATETQRKEDRDAAERWREQFERKSAECAHVSKKLAAREILQRAQLIELEDTRQQLQCLEGEVADQRQLEMQVRELMEAAAQKRGLEGKLQDELTQLKKMIEYQQNQREEMRVRQNQVVTELKKSVRQKDQAIMKQEVTLRELEVTLHKPEVARESRSSQTEVDDDGLWDVQDGVPRFVSKSVLHKMMWRRFNAFVACKNCGGRPLLNSAKTDPLDRNAHEAKQDVDVWSIVRGKKLAKKAAKNIERIEQRWELPSHIVLFLSNLPKSVVAFPFYSTEQVIAQIEAIYDDKFASDKADEADGVAREELPRFVCEYFLKTHGLRQSAEIGLYRFMISVKNSYQRNSHIRLFARLLNLLKSRDEASDASPSHSEGKNDSAATDTITKKKVTSSPDATSSIHLDLKRLRHCSGYLDRAFLRVFLEARHYLLRSPPLLSPQRKLQQRQSEIGTTAAVNGRSRASLEEHVVQVEPTKKWVSLDHAVAVLRWYISYMPEDTIVAYCREVEYSTAIYDGRTIVEVAGNRLAVRAEMRRAMLANDGKDTTATRFASADRPDNDKNQRRPVAPRIVVDVHKVLLLLMSALEQHREVIKKDLLALFDAGDLNHDCVLSVDEFSAIIRTRKPHFSDRRILRMFRKALMGGVDQSFALSMDAFVAVCNDHGLVSLLPEDRMQDPFALPVSKLEGRRMTRASISSSPKQKVGSPREMEDHTDTITTTFANIPEEIPEDCEAETTVSCLVFTPRAEEVSEDEDDELATSNRWQTAEETKHAEQ